MLLDCCRAGYALPRGPSLEYMTATSDGRLASGANSMTKAICTTIAETFADVFEFTTSDLYRCTQAANPHASPVFYKEPNCLPIVFLRGNMGDRKIVGERRVRITVSVPEDPTDEKIEILMKSFQSFASEVSPHFTITVEKSTSSVVTVTIPYAVYVRLHHCPQYHVTPILM